MTASRRRAAVLCGLFLLSAAGGGSAAAQEEEAGGAGVAVTAVAPAAEASPALVLQTAQLLRQSGAPGRAAALLLALEREGMQDAASVEQGLQLLDQYHELDAYARADRVTAVLGARWDAREHNRYWLERAQDMLAHDDVDAAARALQRLRQPPDAAGAALHDSLLGTLLLRQGGYAQFAQLHAGRQGYPRDRLYDHYHHALSLTHLAGRKAEGLALLDELGAVVADTAEKRALRDRINLMLGWLWLAADQGATARPFFKRVSLEGPYSNKALLGLGWAELAPDGSPRETEFSRRLGCADIRASEQLQRRLTDPFPLRACLPGRAAADFGYRHAFAFERGAAGAERFRRALRPWQTLSQREPWDPAVQEALQALAFAQARLGQFGQAQGAYLLAIHRYEEELARLAALDTAFAQPALDTLGLLGQTAAEEFADLRSSSFFVQGRADLEGQLIYVEELENAELRLQRQAAADSVRLGEVQARLARERARFGSERAAFNAELQRRCQADLATRRQRLMAYLAGARLGLALVYDRQRGVR